MKLLDISTSMYPDAAAIVDDDDFGDVAQFKWYRTKAGYAARNLPRPGRGIEYLHRRIMGSPDGLVDHVNRDTLDNRRSNLRVASRQQNAANMRTKSRCGLKGVTFHPQTGKWRARIMVDGRQVSLGTYSTRERAHAEYCAAARSEFGEFARSE